MGFTPKKDSKKNVLVGKHEACLMEHVQMVWRCFRMDGIWPQGWWEKTPCVSSQRTSFWSHQKTLDYTRLVKKQPLLNASPNQKGLFYKKNIYRDHLELPKAARPMRLRFSPKGHRRHQRWLGLVAVSQRAGNGERSSYSEGLLFKGGGK